MGCEMSKPVPKKTTSLKVLTRKVVKRPCIAISVPVDSSAAAEGSASGTTHSGDSPADLTDIRTIASTPEPAEYIDKQILPDPIFDREVLDALAEVDEEHERRCVEEFRAILRGLVKQPRFPTPA